MRSRRVPAGAGPRSAGSSTAGGWLPEIITAGLERQSPASLDDGFDGTAPCAAITPDVKAPVSDAGAWAIAAPMSIVITSANDPPNRCTYAMFLF
jgi:hypothetical protein